MSDYDSGDDLFDGICTPPNEEVQQRPGKRKPSIDEYGDYGDAFEEIASAKRPKLDLADSKDSSVTKLATSILSETFGYETFRHEQQGAINATLRGDNALAIFPTGAGKSLCYQVRLFFDALARRRLSDARRFLRSLLSV